MNKLIALFKEPLDIDAFMNHYTNIHMPLVSKIPGLIQVEVTRIEQTKVGQSGNFLLTEMYFANEESLNAALRSPENAAVSADGMALGGDLVTVMIGQTQSLGPNS